MQEIFLILLSNIKHTNMEFWTHGVSSIVEYPNRVHSLRYAGYGLIIQHPSNGNSQNWLHLPLFSPTKLPFGAWDDPQISGNIWQTVWNEVTINMIKFKGKLNEYARIREIHLRMGEQLIFNQSLDLRGPIVDYSFTPRRLGAPTFPVGLNVIQITEPLVLCLRIEFSQGAIGQAQLIGAGVLVHNYYLRRQ